MPGGTEERLQEILRKPVPTGSTQRYTAVRKEFNLLRDSDPVQAQQLQRRLSRRNDSLRRQMDARLRRAAVPTLIAELGSYPGPQDARMTRRPSTGVATSKTPLVKRPPVRTPAVKVKDRDWPPFDVPRLKQTPGVRTQRYFDRGTDRSEGPFRLTSNNQVLTADWVRRWALNRAREGDDFQTLKKAMRSSREFSGDPEPAIDSLVPYVEDIFHYSRSAQRVNRVEKWKEDRIKEAELGRGVRMLSTRAKEELVKKPKYTGTIELNQLEGHSFHGKARVGHEIRGRKILHFENGMVYFSRGWDVFKQSKRNFEETVRAMNNLGRDVYDRTKHIPRTIFKIERAAGRALSFVPGAKAIGLSEALQWHADEGDKEFDKIEGRYVEPLEITAEMIESGDIPPEVLADIKARLETYPGGAPGGGPGGRRFRPPRSGGKYLHGQRLLDESGVLTGNGISFIRERVGWRRKYKDWTDDEIFRAFNGNVIGGGKRASSGALLEAVVKEEIKVLWKGVPRKSGFAATKRGQKLGDVVESIWKHDPATKRRNNVLNKKVNDLKLSPELAKLRQNMVARMERNARTLSRSKGLNRKQRIALENEIEEISKFLDTPVGSLKPDIVEVQGRRGAGNARVIDATHRIHDEFHNFKTQVYKEAFEKTTKLRWDAKDFRAEKRQTPL